MSLLTSKKSIVAIKSLISQISEKELADHSLRMTVVDTGRHKNNGTIGHIKFPLRHLATEHPNDQLELLKMDLEKVGADVLPEN